jgi:hypothetical protein
MRTMRVPSTARFHPIFRQILLAFAAISVENTEIMFTRAYYFWFWFSFTRATVAGRR